jgi:SAM-dependent methyltransferase
VREANGEVENGQLVCAACERRYPIVSFVPRFVPSQTYASSFGLQWNRFRQTQLDSHSGLPISCERFLEQTGWTQEMLAGKRVLDAGCGAGRFAEITLSLGAEVVAADYSAAVDACWQNLGRHGRLHVIQADLYALPFRPGSFDFVYGLGVLQHTPDVRRAFMALPHQLAAGGRLVVDVYPRHLSRLVHPKSWLRPLTIRVSPQKLLGVIERSAPALLALSRAVGTIPLVGRYLRRLIPVANYEGVYSLSERQLLEWAVLDTFDWLSARYDQPQTPETLRGWLVEAGLGEIEVFRAHHLTGRGRKPDTLRSSENANRD